MLIIKSEIWENFPTQFNPFHPNNAQKMKFSIKHFFSKCDQIRRKLRIWSHLLKKSLMKSLTNLYFLCSTTKYRKIPKTWNVLMKMQFLYLSSLSSDSSCEYCSLNKLTLSRVSVNWDLFSIYALTIGRKSSMILS